MKVGRAFQIGCAVLASLALAQAASAQVSLQTAVSLALKNSPAIHAAQADLDKARAARGEVKDAYVPVVATQAGYGQATGAPLGVPVIFSISAQSLVFSYSQHDYLRSAQASVEAAEHALRNQQIAVLEDTTNTYLALDNALERRKVLQDETEVADRLVTITGERVIAGVDAKVEVPKSRRTATQIRLAVLQLQDEIAGDSRHLATLTGLPEANMQTQPESIPKFEANRAPVLEAEGDGEAIAALYSTAKAKQYVAFGERRYLLRPQVALGLNYTRVDTGLSSYADYYPRYAGTADHPNSQNALSFGLQITLPLLDLAHRSKTREAAADAARAFADADQQRGVFREGRAKLRNAAVELQLRSDLARDEQEIAQDQLDALRIQLQTQGSAQPGTQQASPKDLLSAQLQERQRYVDLLNAQLQLRQTQVNLLRQTESLGVWALGSTGSITPTTPGNAVVQPAVNAPGTPGTAPPIMPTPSPAPVPITPRP